MKFKKINLTLTLFLSVIFYSPLSLAKEKNPPLHCIDLYSAINDFEFQHINLKLPITKLPSSVRESHIFNSFEPHFQCYRGRNGRQRRISYKRGVS